MIVPRLQAGQTSPAERLVWLTRHPFHSVLNLTSLIAFKIWKTPHKNAEFQLPLKSDVATAGLQTDSCQKSCLKLSPVNWRCSRCTPLYMVLMLPIVTLMKTWVTTSPSGVPLMSVACYGEQPQMDRCETQELHSQEGVAWGAQTYHWVAESLWLRNLGESYLPPDPSPRPPPTK